MKHSEFRAWEKDLMTPPTVNEDSTMSKDDYVSKFELSYADAEEVKKEAILALTLPEAIYCAINSVIVSSLPTEGSILGCPSEEEAIKLKNKFIELSSFSAFKFGEIKENAITFTYDNKEYTVSSDEYDFSKIHKIEIHDDMVCGWTYTLTDDRNTMLCTICYNLISIAINQKELVNCGDLMMLGGTVRQQAMAHRNYLVMKFGYASLSPEDEGKFIAEFAEKVSYKRAMLEKLKMDRMAISSNLNGMKAEAEHLMQTITRYTRIFKRIKKREKDIRHYIRNYINSKYSK